jgi:DNA repair ATPase RecN
MELFSAGNLITLGIVALTLIIFRHLDRNNRTLEKVRKYADKLKEDLAAFAAQKAVDVKNYALDLDVEQKAARELMKHLQITDQELADKAAAVAQIDERINAYDKSLEELVKMTGRVQENLNRIREESSCVETAGKQVNEARDRLARMEKNLGEL